MDIRGITKFSLVDFPGKISCIIFASQCNFRCPFCQNPYLVLYYDTQPKISEKTIFNFLKKRQGKLDGVVISGGEPTVHKGLANFAKKVKEMGFAVKLDTNGSNPDQVIAMCEDNLVDMLGIDFKADEANYQKVAASKLKNLSGKVKKLIKYAVDNNIPYDVRSTIHRKFHSEENIKAMRNELNELGVDNWTLQQFNNTEIIDESLLEEDTYSDLELYAISKRIGNNTFLRGMANS